MTSEQKKSRKEKRKYEEQSVSSPSRAPFVNPYPASSSWSITQLTIILTPLKTKNNGAMSTLKIIYWKNMKYGMVSHAPPFTIAPELVAIIFIIRGGDRGER